MRDVEFHAIRGRRRRLVAWFAVCVRGQGDAGPGHTACAIHGEIFEQIRGESEFTVGFEDMFEDCNAFIGFEEGKGVRRLQFSGSMLAKAYLLFDEIDAIGKAYAFVEGVLIPEKAGVKKPAEVERVSAGRHRRRVVCNQQYGCTS